MNTKETDKNYREITERYYSLFLGKTGNMFSVGLTDPFIFYSPIRDNVIEGYGQRIDLFAFSTGNRLMISYGNAAKDKIPDLQKRIITDKIPLCEALRLAYKKEPERSLKYYFSGKTPEQTIARPLTEYNYHEYEAFFIEANNSDPEDINWLRDYFNEMLRDNLCCGVFIDNRLVSCTDSPAIPFISETVREIGITTLKAYRNQGYAKAACSCALLQIIKQGKCPIWSTGWDNVASQRLANELGFKLLGEACSISLDPGL